MFVFQDSAKQNEVLRDAELSQKAFLQRLFPDVAEKVVKAKKHDDWLEEFASCLSKTPASEDQLQKLEGQINHYKSVLAETVSPLFCLFFCVQHKIPGKRRKNWKFLNLPICHCTAAPKNYCFASYYQFTATRRYCAEGSCATLIIKKTLLFRLHHSMKRKNANFDEASTLT